MASEKITAIIEELKGLTVLELSELVHAVEDEFGVSLPAQTRPMRSGGCYGCATGDCNKHLTLAGSRQDLCAKLFAGSG